MRYNSTKSLRALVCLTIITLNGCLGAQPGTWQEKVNILIGGGVDGAPRVITMTQEKSLIAEGLDKIPDDVVDGLKQPGMAFSSGSPGISSISLVRDVQRITRHRYTWFIDTELSAAARAMPGDIIIINPYFLDKYSDLSVMFILLHEASHHLLKHIDESADVQMSATQLWIDKNKELEADGNAAALLAKEKVLSFAIVMCAREALGNMPDSATHPSSKVRVEHIRAKLAEVDSESR